MPDEPKDIGPFDILYAGLTAIIESTGDERKALAKAFLMPRFGSEHNVQVKEVDGAFVVPLSSPVFNTLPPIPSNILHPLFAAAKAWLTIYALGGHNQDGARYTVASKLLSERPAEDTLAREDRAATLLARALQQSAKVILAQVETLEIGHDDPSCVTVLDRTLAMHIETLGEAGKSRAKDLATKSAERVLAFRQGTIDLAALFRLWTVADDAHAARFALVLVEVLWLAAVRPTLERELTKPPAITVGAMNCVSLITSPNLQIQENGVYRPSTRKGKHGGPVLVAGPPTVDAGLAESLIQASLSLAGSVLAWPLLEWLIETAHDLHLSNAPRPDHIGMTGGWRSITAQVLGIPEAKVHGDQQTNLRAMARVLASLPVHWSDGGRSSALFLLNEDNAAAGRGPGRSRVSFKLADRLLPGETFRRQERLGRTPTASDWTDGRLVPVLRPRVVPPMVDSPRNTYGSQAHFVRRLWLHFVENGEQLREFSGEHAGIEVQPHHKRDMAAFVQLPERLTDRLLDHLVASNVVVRVEGTNTLYRPADRPTVDFIRAGAQNRHEKTTALRADGGKVKKYTSKRSKKLGFGWSLGRRRSINPHAAKNQQRDRFRMVQR